MFLLQILLQSWALYHWAYGVETHAFITSLIANFSKEDSVEFVGNATLDRILTHSLEGRNKQFNASQLFPLELPHLWKQRESNLQDYLQSLQALVMLFSKERNIPYPLSIYCTNGCQVSENGTRSFFKILLNGTDFLKFHTNSNSWEDLANTSLANFTSNKLNQFSETTTNLQFFLQETCVNFVRTHATNNRAMTGKHKGHPHTPLVIGISIGALALMGLAVCLFLCTGGKR
ncbi:endothelial protein C receptor [Python bivittatus]|uniref:Endothelial protein C receptor n=1 Tax=Python bivittatus TaxID=176946 RepID=A0A9F5IQF7_PYTBI|nr:endothelial protein C receptor [Python bivittatus]